MKKLSKDEMKKIVGGRQEIVCGYWPALGYQMTLTTCEGNVAGCTSACNAWCANEAGCVDGSCKCM